MSVTDLMNISAFKGLAPSQAFQQALDPNSESLADGIGSSYGIIGYKGKVWSLRLRGETHMFVRPDDGSPAAFLDVIILRAPPYKSKSYYPAGTFQDGALGTRPTCAALDGVAPDADIATPQSNACAICPKNVFKLNAEGRKTRECSDYKRLAVLILPSQSKMLLGAPLMEPVFLRVPAASLNDLAMLGEGMQAQGFHYSSYVTRIGFNPEKPHPQMTFRALVGLTDKEAPIVLPLREDPVAIRITGENETGKARATPNPVDEAAVRAQAAAEAAKASAAKAATEAAAEAERVRLAAEAAAKEAAARAATTIDTGFGDLGITAAVNQPASGSPGSSPETTVGLDFGATGTVVATPAAANTHEDTGAPEPTDLGLDDRIKSLLPNLVV
jgi:hypothetical protein